MYENSQTVHTTYARGQYFGSALHNGASMFQPSAYSVQYGDALAQGEQSQQAQYAQPPYVSYAPMSKAEADAVKSVAKVSAITQMAGAASELIGGITREAIAARAARRQLELQQAHDISMAPYTQSTLNAQAKLKDAEARITGYLAEGKYAENMPLIVGIVSVCGLGVAALAILKPRSKKNE